MATIDNIAFSNSTSNVAPGLGRGLTGLGRTLVHAGKLEQKVAEEIFITAVAKRSSFIAELTGSGAVSAQELARTLSLEFSIPLIDLDAVDLQRLPKGVLSAKICQDYRLVVLGKRNNRLIIATADPSDQQAAEKVKFSAQLTVDWVIAEYDKLLKVVSATTASATETIDNLIGQNFEFDDLASEPTPDTSPADTSSEVEDAPVVKFLHKMLLDAFNMRASDLHFEPYEHNYRVRFRIDGELREVASPPIVIKDKLVSRIKVISRMDISEKRVPQDGKMKLKIGADRVIDFRVRPCPRCSARKW